MTELSFNKFLQSRADYPVCIEREQVITHQALLHDVGELYQRINLSQEKRWVLAVNGTVNFVRGFLALMLAGKEVLLPANNRPGTLKDGIQEPHAIITDFEIETSLPCINVNATGNSSSVPDISDISISLQDCFIEICTSGSTGEPKQIRKTLATLIDELNCLENLWGPIIGQNIFISTVSHQHIYGLLFRVLWPLLTGRLFMADNIEYPEQIGKIASRQGGLVLISSPAYLKRMIDVLNDTMLDSHLKIIFSSGGPLSRETAEAYDRKLGVFPMEVLGSTETGGVAYRQQNAGEESVWRKMPQVNVRSNQHNGALEILSPFCFSRDWYTMGDRVELINQTQFRLMGRLDRIVKLEEKRISLDNMEDRLGQSSLIQQAMIIAIQGDRTVLGVVAILTTAGCSQLEKMGKKDFTRHLRAYLSSYFERVTLPRKWRYVHDFPYNTQGKVTQQALLALF